MQAHELRKHILTFITTLALSHANALETLLRSQALIPALVLYLTDATNAFWEEEEKLVSSSAAIDQYVLFTSAERV